MVFLKAPVTAFSICSSSSVSRQLPAASLLSWSSPAVRPMRTMAASAALAASPAISSVMGISAWNQGSLAQPLPGSKGWSLIQAS